jgi:hypothetical protein
MHSCSTPDHQEQVVASGSIANILRQMDTIIHPNNATFSERPIFQKLSSLDVCWIQINIHPQWKDIEPFWTNENIKLHNLERNTHLLTISPFKLINPSISIDYLSFIFSFHLSFIAQRTIQEMFCFSIKSTDSTYSKILLFVKTVALENHFFIRHSFLLKLIISLLSLL